METLQYDPNVLIIDLGPERMTGKPQNIEAEASWYGIPIEGFTGPGEEMIRAVISRVPPELLGNVHRVKAAPELQPKHGRYDPETHTVNINPLIFNLRQRFGKGQGWIYHTELCTVHEIGHSIYYFFPEKVKDEWRDISGWMVGTQAGQAEPYKETRLGWPPSTSKWTHRLGVKFTRKYAKKNDDEDFADSFAFFILNKPHQMEPAKRDFIQNVIADRVKKYPQPLIEGPTKPYGEKELHAGGPGSGCNPEVGKCGRPATGEKTTETFYHGTIGDAVKKVLEEGLQQKPEHQFNISADPSLPGKIFIPKGYVYMTKSKEVAKWYARVKAEYEMAKPGSVIQVADPAGFCCLDLYKTPDAQPPATKGKSLADFVAEKPSVITMELPKEIADSLEPDEASQPHELWQAFRKNGTIPKEYISNIEQWDVMDGSDDKWDSIWNPKTKTLTAENTVPLYLVFYGTTKALAEALFGKRDVQAGGPGSGCNPEVAQPRCGRPAKENKPVQEETRVHESTLPDFGWKAGSRYKKVLDAIKDGRWHPLEGHPSPKTGFYTGMRVNMRKLGYNVVTKNNQLRLVKIKQGELLAKPVHEQQQEPHHYTLKYPTVDQPMLGRDEYLAKEHIKSVDSNPDEASAISKIVHFDDGKQALFKPASGEFPNLRPRGISDGYSIQRELGAWQVAKVVGLDDMVAASTARKVDGEDGVLIEWQKGDVAHSIEDPDAQYDGKEGAAKAALFDYVIGNEDRHAGNWVVENSDTPEKAKLHLIDHNLTFPDKDVWDVNHNAYFIDRFTGRGKDENPLPFPLVQSYISSEDKILEALRKVGLPDGSIDGVKSRIDHMAKAKNWKQLLKPYGYWGA